MKWRLTSIPSRLALFEAALVRFAWLVVDRLLYGVALWVRSKGPGRLGTFSLGAIARARGAFRVESSGRGRRAAWCAHSLIAILRTPREPSTGSAKHEIGLAVPLQTR